MENYLTIVWTALQGKLIVLAILMALDFILGTVVALIQHEFDWQKLDHFLQTDFLPILAWVVVVFLVNLPAQLLPNGVTIPVVADVVYGIVFLAILTSLLQSLAKAGVLTNLLSKAHIPYASKKQLPLG